ncbi:hypothetical protein FOCC_FOCC002449, partial [Frankliniella occidentalis]
MSNFKNELFVHKLPPLHAAPGRRAAAGLQRAPDSRGPGPGPPPARDECDCALRPGMTDRAPAVLPLLPRAHHHVTQVPPHRKRLRDRTKVVPGWTLGIALLMLLLLPLARAAGGISAAVPRDPRDLSELDEPAPLSEVRAAAGQAASLPCSARPSARTTVPGDSLQMLLWYSESAPDNGIPIYRVDARGRPLSQARRWSSPSWFGSRARVVIDGDLVRLVVQPLRDSDHGMYRCRADFKDSPTRNTRVSLFVSLPPTQLVVTQAAGGARVPVDVLAPLSEGEELSLACEAMGGRPPPSVVWLLGDQVVDDSWEPGAGGASVVNKLVMPALGRQHLQSLVCRAVFDPDAPPVERELFLDLHLRPLSVRIVGRERVLLAGQSYEFQCRCSGSRPAARLSWWWRGGAAIKGPVRKLVGSETETISLLTLTPRPQDDGRYIECRAENPLFADSEIRDAWRLSVQYPPKVSLRMGAKINASAIKVGDDVYLECGVDAQPNATLVTWTHNGLELKTSPARGVLLNDRTLILQRVGRGAAGSYVCAASNSEGRGQSPPLPLAVLFPPECARRGPQLLGALLHEPLELACAVEALPPPQWFRWKFNETLELPRAARAHGGSTGRLTLAPAGPQDYGLYACWADNHVGQQAQPCLIRVVHAGAPLPPSNCSMARLLTPAGVPRPAEIRERTPPWSFGADLQPPPPQQPATLDQHEDGVDGHAGTLRVDCRAPPASGLPEHFQLHLLREPLAVLRYNLTLPGGAPPVWELPWAPEPGATYSARVYAVNAKGRSEATVLEGGPLRGADPTAADPSNLSGGAADPLLGGLVAASCALLLVASGALLAIAACRPRRRAAHQEDAEEDGDVHAAADDDQDRANGAAATAATSLLLVDKNGGAP